MSALVLRGVSKVFGSLSVLSEIDLVVEERENRQFAWSLGMREVDTVVDVAGLESADRGIVQNGGKWPGMAEAVSGCPSSARR